MKKHLTYLLFFAAALAFYPSQSSAFKVLHSKKVTQATINKFFSIFFTFSSPISGPKNKLDMPSMSGTKVVRGKAKKPEYLTFGLKENDVIISINSVRLNSLLVFSKIASKKPDFLNIEVLRGCNIIILENYTH